MITNWQNANLKIILKCKKHKGEMNYDSKQRISTQLSKKEFWQGI